MEMTTRKTDSFAEVQRNLQGFLIALNSAACEWCLLFWLLIDSIFSFLLTKFALYCELQTPCIFCSRLDNEKPEFYQNLLCNNHKSEISSLISCHIHGNLVFGHEMCEECLLSFVKKSKPNPGMNKFLLAKFGFDLGDCTGLNISSTKIEPVSGFKRFCSCCKMPCTSMKNAKRICQKKSSKTEMIKPNIPVSRRFDHREGLKRMKERFSGSVSPSHPKKASHDPLSHVGYTELNIISDSDSDSEFPFSDDDEGLDIHEAKAPKEEPKLQKIPKKTIGNDLVPKMSELMSLDFPSRFSLMDDHGAEKCELKFPLSHNLKPSAFSHQLMSLVDAPSFTAAKASCKPLHGKFDKENGVTVIPKEKTSTNKELQRGYHEDSEPQVSIAESYDECSVGEIDEGAENIIEQLKRQIRYDKQRISELYTELEKERSASAIAANQAMAMITRLQEEKASVRMEALQYLRMMEEQAEFDVEALEKANEVLAEKDKEIQDMEAEIESLKFKPPEKSSSEEDTKDEEKEEEEDGDSGTLKSPWSDFGDEKMFISKCLKGLERKIHQISHQNDSTESAPGSNISEEEESFCKEMEDDDKLLQNGFHGNENSDSNENNEVKIDLDTLEHEVLDLNERLEALEGDWIFLEHTFNSLQTGKEGVEFVKEIAHQLQELRKFGSSNGRASP